MLADIRRVKNDGELYIYPGDISYSAKECKKLRKKAFDGFEVNIVEGGIVNEPRNIGETEYKLNATQVIAVIEELER